MNLSSFLRSSIVRNPQPDTEQPNAGGDPKGSAVNPR
jgi:hypothetical protein